jgi:type IV secretion system protein VirB5
MTFRRAVQRYGRTPEPETPYQRAGQVWDERIGAARVQARNWRLMAFGGCFSRPAVGRLLWQSVQSRVVPYVVEVDRLGEARAVSPAEAGYRPTDPQIAWHLGRFVGNVRSISLDPVLMRQNWLSAYDFVTARGALFLGEHARAANPFGDVGRRTVSVQVTSVVRALGPFVPGEVDREALLSAAALPERRAGRRSCRWWSGHPPRPRRCAKNPLGLYVDAIDWSRELDVPPQARPASVPNALPLGSPLDPSLGRDTEPSISSERSSR